MRREDSGTGTAAAAAAAELRSVEGWRELWQPHLSVQQRPVSAQPGLGPHLERLPSGVGEREEEGQRAARGRKTQWIANLSPNREHEHSFNKLPFINLGSHACSCLPTRTCSDNVQSNKKEQTW